MKRISVAFDHQLHAAIERAAAAEGVSKSELVRRILRERVRPAPRKGRDGE